VVQFATELVCELLSALDRSFEAAPGEILGALRVWYFALCLCLSDVLALMISMTPALSAFVAMTSEIRKE